MGRSTEFDHFDLAKDLDFSSWDSYPLGFLEDRVTTSEDKKRKFSRQGDPDFQAFHHDLYREAISSRVAQHCHPPSFHYFECDASSACCAGAPRLR